MQLKTALSIIDTYKDGNEYARSHPDWLQFSVVYLAEYNTAHKIVEDFYQHYEYETANAWPISVRLGFTYKKALRKYNRYMLQQDILEVAIDIIKPEVK